MKMYIATIPAESLRAKSRSAFYVSQKRLFIIVVILVSVVPLVVISFSSFHYYRQSWIEKTSRELLGLADSRREMIEMFLINQEHLLGSLFELYQPEFLITQDTLEKVLSAVNRDDIIVDLGVIDNIGDHRAYVGPYNRILSGKNYLDTQWFRETMKKGRFVSDIFSGYRNEPHFIVAVTDPARKWVLRATVNSEYFNALLSSADVGAGGDAYIVNKAGLLQTPSRLASANITRGVTMPLSSNAGPDVLSSGRFIYATSPLKGVDWILVLKTDIDTSLSEFYSARNRDIVFIVLAASLVVAVAVVLIRYLMKRLEHADYQRMKINNRMLEVEKMALIGRLAASVAHEINNPLQVIDDQAGWILDLLSEEEKNRSIHSAEYRSSAGKIRAHVKRARNITHKLLGFSRFSEDERVPTDVNDLINESVSFFESEADRHQITIRKNLEPGLQKVTTAPAQIQQVFINIINNAIDAIGQNGVITINTRSGGNGSIIAEIADSGPGIRDEVMQKMFDPFFSTKKGGDNTGLGLSISLNMLQRLGGDINARNGRQGGSVFTVSIPAEQGRIK